MRPCLAPIRSKRQPMSTMRRWLVLAPVLLVLGCGVLPPPNLKAPVLTFRDLEVRDVGLERVRFNLIVDVSNPNAVDVPVTGLNFVLELNGQETARGAAADPSFVLPGSGTRQVPLEFSARTADLLDVVRRLPGSLQSGLSYRLKGSASWGVSGFAIPFDRSGSLDLRAALRRLLPPGRLETPPAAPQGGRT
jgi:LEA14-like dessication related protein